jgi:hypothetical protein
LDASPAGTLRASTSTPASRSAAMTSPAYSASTVSSVISATEAPSSSSSSSSTALAAPSTTWTG